MINTHTAIYGVTFSLDSLTVIAHSMGGDDKNLYLMNSTNGDLLKAWQYWKLCNAASGLDRENNKMLLDNRGNMFMMFAPKTSSCTSTCGLGFDCNRYHILRFKMDQPGSTAQSDWTLKSRYNVQLNPLQGAMKLSWGET